MKWLIDHFGCSLKNIESEYWDVIFINNDDWWFYILRNNIISLINSYSEWHIDDILDTFDDIFELNDWQDIEFELYEFINELTWIDHNIICIWK